MKKQNTNPNKMYESPKLNVNKELQMERTKTLKRHNYFEGGMKGINCQNKQVEGGMSGILGHLASYISEKNGEIPWTKKYDWQQILVSSEEKSSNQNEKQYMKKSKNTVQQDQSQHFENQHDFSRDSDEFVDFLLRINKISKTQSFSNQQSLSNNINNSKSDSEDFDELMMLVEREEKKKKQKQREKKNPSSSLRMQQPGLLSGQQWDYQQYFISSNSQRHQLNPSFHSNIHLQEIDSPIIARHRPVRELIDHIQSPRSDDDDSLLQQLQKKPQRYLQSSSQESSIYQQEELKQQKQQQKQKIQKQQPKKQNNQNKLDKSQIINNKSSSYKIRRLRKQRQQQPICTICMSEIEQRGKLPCKHDFCLSCLKDWLQKTSSCPICRKDAKYYKHNDQKYKVQQKKYSLQNFIENIGDDSYDDDSDEELDYECENCDQTQYEDEILICDRCLVNATHIACDIALGGMAPPQDMNWYCSVCRQSPSLWFLQSRHN